ncbi:hypothetical protein BBJ28_00000438 [Nothophytophthora sp. Chile5]|nr:hypothetical protein BBJ28_00000438 [Nothophytophthora sp. Chile5]
MFRSNRKQSASLSERGAQHNVVNTYVFTLFFWASRSILFQQVISGYIYVLTNSNQPVGIVKGIQGISQLVFALPAGYLADHIRRDSVLKMSGVIGLVGALLTFVAVELSNLTAIYVAFALWGIFAAFQSPAMEALFADSIPAGRRSHPFMVKYNVGNVAMVIGPFLSILLFLYVGDVWRVQELRPVLIFGTVLAAIASLFLFRYNDDLALREGEGAPLQELSPLNQRMSIDSSEPLLTPSFASNALEFDYNYSDDEEDLDFGDDLEQDDERKNLIQARVNQVVNIANTGASTEKSSLVLTVTTPAADGGGTMTTPKKTRTHSLDVHSQGVTFLGLSTEHVPYILFTSDFILSNGAGMTINFFPLFFMKEYGLTPVQVSALFLAQPIVVLVLSYVGQKSSRTLGRMPIIVWTRMAATACLLCMAYAQPLQLQIVLFLMRGGMMRCSQPLRRSVLMDFVRREVRARWNALEGISVFSFSGSAMIGGYLVDMYDYRTCFFITSFVYFSGLCLELLLIPLTRHAVEK